MPLRSLYVSMIALLLCTGVAHAVEQSPTSITIAIFRSPKCDTCTSIEPEPLRKLGVKLGVEIRTRTYNVDKDNEYRLLCIVERDLRDADNEFPAVVIGDKILGGNKEIEDGLEAAIKEAVGAGKTSLPPVLLSAQQEADKGSAPKGGKPTYAAFFSQGGCATCNRMLASLRYLKSQYPSFDYRAFDTREPEAMCLFEALCEEHRVSEADRRRSPAVFVGGKSLLEKAVTPSAVENLVSTSIDSGTDKPWEIGEEALAAARERIMSRFEKLGPWTVVAAGLIDGINPCAFATIVFFITYLSATGMGKREILAVGLCFSAAVFATYFAVGLGALQAILKLRIYAQVSKTIDVVAGVMAALFGFLSVWDYFKARKGKIDEMRLVLPSFLKRRINVSIPRQFHLRGAIMGGVAAGGLVSLFELACTGQVYLPTIALISGNLVLRMKALTYLALYNLMFVLPLLVILGTAHLGMTSERLTALFRRNIAASKLALAALFFAISAVVFVTLLSH